MPHILPAYHASNLLHGLFVRIGPTVGEVEVYDGVRAAHVHVAGVVLRNSQPIKEAAAVGHIALRRRLEEALQHAQERGLAKAPGPAVERHAAPVHELPHGKRLVHVGKAPQHVLEALDANGKLATPTPVNDVRLTLGFNRSVAHVVSLAPCQYPHRSISQSPRRGTSEVKGRKADK